MHFARLLQASVLLVASCSAAVTTITKTSTKSVTVTKSVTTTAPAITKTITTTRTSISTIISTKTAVSTITSTKTQAPSTITATITKTQAPSTITATITKSLTTTTTAHDTTTATTTTHDTSTITACPYQSAHSSSSSNGGWIQGSSTPTTTTAATTPCTPILDLQFTNAPDSAYNLQYFQLQTDGGDASAPFKVSYESDQYAWSYLTFDPSSGYLYDYRDVSPAVYAVVDTTQDPSALLFDTSADASANNLTPVVCSMPGDLKPSNHDVNAFTCSAGGLGTFLVPSDGASLLMGSAAPGDGTLFAVDLVGTVLNCDDEVPQV